MRFNFRNDWSVIGRDSSCDWVVDAQGISRRHARIRPEAGRCILEDLGSANGTFVNGRRIDGSCSVRVGDVIGLGRLQFEVIRQGVRLRVSDDGFVIEVQNLTVETSKQRVLEDISLTILPSEFVGLMGNSGAGKTTLMNAMNGYTHPASGTVLINGVDLGENYRELSTSLGYVPQDDIMHRELTVRQALYYTARLRMSADATETEIHSRIETVVSQLGLQNTIETPIGSPERRGISGGQRKRVNLAMELLTAPAVLFLDEPTSGLSSEDTLRVMKLLRELADSGKSIVLTIHSPSIEAYRLMDNLILVAKTDASGEPGRLVYYGPAFPDALLFLNPGKPRTAIDKLSADDLFEGLRQHPVEAWCKRYEKSPHHQSFVVDRAGTPVDQGSLSRHAPPRRSFLNQCRTLTERNLRIKIADTWNTTILLAQAPIVALILVLVFGERATRQLTMETWAEVTGATSMTVFLAALSALWFGCSNAVREIVGELSIYRRERMVNLLIPAYVTSKLLIGTLFCAIQCAILVGVARWGCGLKAPPLTAFLLLMLIACTGLSIGLLLSALSKTSEMAIGLLPLALIPMVVLGGGMLPVQKMQSPVRLLAYCLPLRSGFEALLLSESNRRPLGPSAFSGNLSTAGDASDADRPDMAEEFFPKNRRVGIGASAALLAGMLATLVVAIHVTLALRDIR